MTDAIGRPLHRLEDPPLLTGTARFVDDIALPGVLQVAFVRSPHAHAAIRRIDVGAARALPGVHAVLTLDDLKKVLARPRMVAGPRSSRSCGNTAAPATRSKAAAFSSSIAPPTGR